MSDRMEIRPLLTEDLEVVGGFLHGHFNPALSPGQWRNLFMAGWNRQAPDHGRVVFVGQRLVGVIGGLYSLQEIHGRMENFCNIHTWMVLEEYRTASMKLLLSLLEQKGVHFTNMTANEMALKTSRFFKFVPLETGFIIRPNVPGWFGGVLKVWEDERAEACLPLDAGGVYRDHRGLPGINQWVVEHGGERCHVVFRRTTWRRWSCAEILHARPLGCFQDWYAGLAVHFLVRRLAYTRTDLRFLPAVPWLSRVISYKVPRLFLSSSLSSLEISNLYCDDVVLGPR